MKERLLKILEEVGSREEERSAAGEDGDHGDHHHHDGEKLEWRRRLLSDYIDALNSDAAEDGVSFEDRDRVYAGISRRIKESRLDIRRGEKTKMTRRLLFISRIAASLIIMAGLFFLYDAKSDPFSFVYMINDEVEHIARGDIKMLNLPDGTKVWVNSDSKIRYFDSNSDKVRRVYLYGEAYFEVARDESRPFEIYAKGAKVKVLGTKFNVTAYSDTEGVETSVLSGLVSFGIAGDDKENEKKQVLLSHNMKGVYSKDAGNIEVTKVEEDEINAWVHGRLVFKSCELRHIVRVLERKFNVTIALDSKIKDKLITATFKNSGLREILDLLSLTNELKYERNDAGFLIYE